jgi:8-oxo-dGTP pyrophosphatase MutT (NUDIX family)
MKKREVRERVGDLWYVHYASAGGVVIHAGRVLLVRKTMAPEIRLPKGHIEPDESRAETALREVREETGYQHLRVVADLGSLHNTFRRAPDVIVSRNESFFLMALDDDAQVEQPAEDRAKFEVMWAPLAQAESLLTFEVEREFIRRARRFDLSSPNERCDV